MWFKETLEHVKDKTTSLLHLTEEKRTMLANQNTLLEQQVNEGTEELKLSLDHLKATQDQLIQSEKWPRWVNSPQASPTRFKTLSTSSITSAKSVQNWWKNYLKN
ncbi:MAG: hypothetical protein IPN29_00500 [Saprospiraceae bacterium]|nr:hypothetical protein [Saprospiraceae bacterium]